MVLGGVFKGLFGATEPEPARPAGGPLGLGLGRAVSLDTMRLRLEAKRLARGVPSETLVVTGHGVADLGGTAVIHRYYDESNTMLQVLCEGGTGDENVREITLYHPWDEVVPTTDPEWAAWSGEGGRMGRATYEADGFVFERVWGEPATAWVAPAEFTETVTTEDGESHIHQRIMPFRREVGTAVETLLIAVERNLASGDRGTVTFMIGYGLSLADVTPV